MYNIFEIAKYAKKTDRQEDLVTGILVWCIERNKNLLCKIIEKSTSPTNNEKPDLSNSSIKCKLQRLIIGEDKNSKPDATIFANNNCTLLIENKIVQKDERLLGQVKDYHINANDDNKDFWVLLITPDKKEYIDEEIFKKLDEKHLAKTLWIKWSDVCDICEKTENDFDKIILNELMMAINKGMPPIGTKQYSVCLYEEIMTDTGWNWWDVEAILVDWSEDISDVKNVLKGNVEEILKYNAEIEQLLVQLKQKKEKGELSEEEIKELKKIAAEFGQDPKEEIKTGTIQYSVYLWEDVVNKDGKWVSKEIILAKDSKDINDVKKVLKGDVEKILEEARNIARKKKAKEEARKKREDRKMEPEEEE